MNFISGSMFQPDSWKQSEAVRRYKQCPSTAYSILGYFCPLRADDTLFLITHCAERTVLICLPSHDLEIQTQQLENSFSFTVDT